MITFRIARKEHDCYWCGTTVRRGQGYWDCRGAGGHAECVRCGPDDEIGSTAATGSATDVAATKTEIVKAIAAFWGCPVKNVTLA